MAGNTTQFGEFIQEQVEKYRGRTVPVKASFAERVIIRNLSCDKLHPNPYDEFSFPDIGPNYDIISEYGHRIKEARKHGDPPWDDPILVEKMLPDGYLILNGHHRWAAAVRFGLPKVQVRVVNLTQETDIKKMLEMSAHDKRVSFDLDEVIFAGKDSKVPTERIGFIQGKLIKERLRRGVPALFHYLAKKGYDIWVYSAHYYSTEYIKRLFKGYHAPVNGIVTGTSRAHASDGSADRVRDMFADHYTETMHIDNKGILRTFAGGADFEQYELTGDNDSWSGEIMNTVEKVIRK